MKRTNLVLIGMPASGKSTVGVILAKLIGFDFMDTDLLIQRAEKRRLSQIIADEGMDGFLDIENRVNASVEADHCVIATGGSAVYGREAMEHFRRIGHIIYLKVDYPQLARFQQLLASVDGVQSDETYAADVTLTATLPLDNTAVFEERVRETFNATIAPEPIDTVNRAIASR